VNADSWIESLGWLPEAAPLTRRSEAPGFDALRGLASSRRDFAQMERLARLARGVAADPGAVAAGDRPRIWLTGNVTLDFLAPALEATGPRFGLLPQVELAPFDQILMPLLSGDARLEALAPDTIVLVLDLLPRLAALDPTDDPTPVLEAQLGEVEQLGALAAERYGARLLVTTTPAPVTQLFGHLEAALASTARSAIERFNEALRGLSSISTVDFHGWANLVGLARWRVPRMWHKAKLAFAPELTPLAADLVLRAVAAQRGKSRRCLVLDLDNTLWGGVVGDDGPEHVLIGQGNAVGEAHLAVQQLARQLQRRGVVLAVSSKNEHATALLPFQTRDEMALSLDDIAVFQANWRDKASNIEAIADTLGLGLASLVFLDDNPAERAQVRMALPEVAVPELPEDPADFPLALSAPGYFEATGFSVEDRKRGQDYAANARRVQLKAEAGDLDSYLRSLAMVLELESFTDVRLPRVAELFAKTNQFNLTLERYNEIEVRRRMGEGFSVQATLRDRFGDNGLIAAVLVETGPVVWTISNWVMRCRVLGRRVEEAVLDYIVAAARAAGAEQLRGRFVQGPRNDLVREHYPRLGFAPLGADPEGEASFTLTIADFEAPRLPFAASGEAAQADR
jgi:FkbH-like protein